MEKRLVRIAGALLDMMPQATESGIADIGSEPNIARARYDVSQAVVNSVNDYLSGNNRGGIEESGKLRERVAKYVSLPVENARCFSSPETAIETIARTYLEHGAEVVINSPAHKEIAIAAQGTGAKVINIASDSPANPQIETVINHIGPRTRMIFIENPNHVTGAMFSEAEIVFLLAYAESSMVVVDERYFEFSGRTVSDLVKRFPNLMVIRNIAEVHGMGPLCAGYIISDAENLEFVDRIAPSDPNAALAYRAAEAALNDPDCLQRNRVSIERARKLLGQYLPEIGYESISTPTDFLLLKTANMEFALRLFTDSGFRAEPINGIENLTNFVRVELGLPESAETLLMELSLAAGHLATGYNRNVGPSTTDRLAALKKQAVTIG
jgi:histidinol-phosphate aminotransferase